MTKHKRVLAQWQLNGSCCAQWQGNCCLIHDLGTRFVGFTQYDNCSPKSECSKLLISELIVQLTTQMEDVTKVTKRVLQLIYSCNTIFNC